MVGLAVDYVVHLAQAYVHSPRGGRLDRTQHALELVGVSVMSGAGTTLCAMSMLLFANFVFFHQFGVVLFATIGFSFVYAIGFFMTVLAIVGPQEHTGSIRMVRRFVSEMFGFSRRPSAQETRRLRLPATREGFSSKRRSLQSDIYSSEYRMGSTASSMSSVISTDDDMPTTVPLRGGRERTHTRQTY